MEIKHPRRILVIGAPNSGTLTLLKDLTGSAPVPVSSDDEHSSGPVEQGSTAGLTHEWDLKTAYYSARIPIWVDEIGDLEAWKAEFCAPEAREVVRAVGAWVYCFRKGEGEGGAAGWERGVQDAMRAVEEVVRRACGYEWEGTRLAVGTSAAGSAAMLDMEAWEERSMELGFEVVDADAKGKNEFGEAVGMDRIREALEANDWSGAADGEGQGEGAGEGAEDWSEDEFGMTTGPEHSQMNAELWGLKASLLGQDEDGDEGDEAAQVDGLEQMMSQVLAIKENGADMPLEQRKRYAAKAVNDLMKTV